MPNLWIGPIIRFLKSAEGVVLTPEEVVEQLTINRTFSHPDMGEIQKLSGALGKFWVTSRGNVVSYFAPPQPSARDSLSPEEASKLAREFILRHHPDFPRRNFELIHEEVEYSVWKGMWEERPFPDEVSIYRNIIRVHVSLLTHSITDYYGTDLRFVRKTPPKISEAEARKIALEEFQDGGITEIYLMENPVEGGKRAITVWRVRVETVADPEDDITRIDTRLINADTGELVPLYRKE